MDAFAFAVDVMADQPAEAGGVYVGDVGEVDDVEGGWLLAGRGLEGEHIVQLDRS